MIDVAREAGVSLKTVSRAVNKVPTLDPELASRVMAAIDRLGYRRNDVAAKLRSGSSTSTIGVIIGDISNSFYSAITAAVSEVARANATQVFTASAEEDVRVERELALDLCLRRVDGLLVVPARGDQSYLAPEIAHGIPAVFVDRPPSGLDADTFLLDNAGGSAAGVAALLAEGHSRIGVIVDSLDIFTMRERLDGVEAAFAAVGRTLAPELLSTEGHAPRSAAAAAETMLALAEPPTALYAGNNRALAGIVLALRRTGRSARVFGTDDFELSELLPERVSLITYDVEKLGRLAATRLFERIGGDTSPAQLVRLPFRVVDRGGGA